MARDKIHKAEYDKQYRKDNAEKIKEYSDKHNKEYYKKNAERIKTNHAKYRERRRDFVYNYKMEKGCAICGYDKCAAALVFHHEKGDKQFGIGTCINRSMENLKKEMDKCIVLCANCHRELHEREKLIKARDELREKCIRRYNEMQLEKYDSGNTFNGKVFGG